MNFITTCDAQGRVVSVNGATQDGRSLTFAYDYLTNTAIPKSTILQQHPFQTTKTFEPGSTRVATFTNTYNNAARSAFEYTHALHPAKGARVFQGVLRMMGTDWKTRAPFTCTANALNQRVAISFATVGI